jgi:hypothetical protein
MTLRHFEENQLVEYESTQSGMPHAHHARHVVPANGGFVYRLVVEYEPRSGLRGLYDRLLLQRGVERVLRRTVANLDANVCSVTATGPTRPRLERVVVRTRTGLRMTVGF